MAQQRQVKGATAGKGGEFKSNEHGEASGALTSGFGVVDTVDMRDVQSYAQKHNVPSLSGVQVVRISPSRTAVTTRHLPGSVMLGIPVVNKNDSPLTRAVIQRKIDQYHHAISESIHRRGGEWIPAESAVVFHETVSDDDPVDSVLNGHPISTFSRDLASGRLRAEIDDRVAEDTLPAGTLDDLRTRLAGVMTMSDRYPHLSAAICGASASRHHVVKELRRFGDLHGHGITDGSYAEAADTLGVER